MDGKVHLAQPDRLHHALLTVYSNVAARIAFVVLNESRTGNKHAARAAGRVKQPPVEWLDHVDDQVNHARRCKELAALLALLHRERAEEILVNLAEGIALDGAAWSKINFSETRLLKFAPVATA